MSEQVGSISNPAPARRILLAEDNAQELVLLRVAFQAAQFEVEIDWLPDGDVVLNQLRADSEVDSGSYGLVVLDLHLPKRSAREILVTLQAEEKLLKMPVVVLTSLISEQEKLSLLALGVHEILIKPAELDGYFKLARQLAALYV